MFSYARKDKRGMVMITALTVVTVLIILSTAIVHMAVTEYNFANTSLKAAKALYLAEACVAEIAFNLSEKIANFEEDDKDNKITDQPWDVLELGGVIGNYLSTGFDVTHYECVPISDGQQVPDPNIPTLTCFERIYRLSADVSDPHSGIGTTVSQTIVRRKTYTFQHAVFYDTDLEMLPGKDMTLSGKVHCNSDIYIGAKTTFTIDTEYLYSAGGIFNRRKDSATSMDGDVDIRIKDSAPAAYDLMKKGGESDPLDCDRANWTDESQVRWGGTVKSSVHGVQSLATPAVASIKPDGYYADNAALKITKKSWGGWEIIHEGVSIGIGALPEDTVTESTFKDKRENKMITVTNVDIDKLNNSGYFPDNGLLYTSREDASATQPNGIRLQNGGILESKLTVVSDCPVYIHGNYNIGDPDDPDYPKRPALVICDAMNLLSKDWDDTKSDDSLDNRIAGDTEVNTAFVSGITPTEESTYSGGLENYPRLHEKWSGKTLSIRGSFISLWDSEIGTGDWGNSDVYKAPNRDWDYDTSFNNPNNLPPFPPRAIELNTRIWQLN